VADAPKNPIRYETAWEKRFQTGLPEQEARVLDRKAQTEAAIQALTDMEGRPFETDYSIAPDEARTLNSQFGLAEYDKKKVTYDPDHSGKPLRNTLVHEFMHTKGHKHNENPADIMARTAGTEQEQINRDFVQRQGLSPDEIDDQQLAFTKTHIDHPSIRRSLYDNRWPHENIRKQDEQEDFEPAPTRDLFTSLKQLLGMEESTPFTEKERIDLMNYVQGDKRKTK
jgi:hypothetical protein